jgi:hypothetical protein
MNKTCDMCGNEFDFAVKITPEAGSYELIASETATPEIVWLDVQNIKYATHTGPSGKEALKVTYWCGGKKRFHDFIFMDETVNPNFLGHRARGWWQTRWKGHPDQPGAMPETTAKAFMYANQTNLKEPRRIEVLLKGKDGFPEIIAYEYE